VSNERDPARAASGKVADAAGTGADSGFGGIVHFHFGGTSPVFAAIAAHTPGWSGRLPAVRATGRG